MIILEKWLKIEAKADNCRKQEVPFDWPDVVKELSAELSAEGICFDD
jgi:hypothetical protein